MTLALRDASDRLSPILVKELRQGVRSHVFTGAFLLQQFLLMAVAALGLLLDGSRDEWSVFFWMFIVLPILLILPLSAGASVSGEKAAGTLEPMLLTRLSAWRVAAGKWAATAAQTTLLVVAALPYVLMRYFLGGVNLVGEVATLCACLLCSLLLTSVAVALSPASLSPLFRWALSAFLGLFLAIAFWSVAGQASFGPGASRGTYLAFGALVLLTLILALEVAALQMAPPALARPARLRVLALLVVGVAIGYARQPFESVSGILFAWCSALVLGVVAASLCEPVPPSPTLYAPFFRSRLRAAAGLVLAPGWPAGVGFTLLVVLGAWPVFASKLEMPTEGVVVLGLLGTLLLPVLFGPLFERRQPLLGYLLVQVVSFGLSTLAPVGVVLESKRLSTFGYAMLGLCPAAYALRRLREPVFGEPPMPAFAGAVFLAVVAITLVIAFWRAARAWAGIRALVRGRSGS